MNKILQSEKKQIKISYDTIFCCNTFQLLIQNNITALYEHLLFPIEKKLNSFWNIVFSTSSNVAPFILS